MIKPNYPRFMQLLILRFSTVIPDQLIFPDTAKHVIWWEVNICHHLSDWYVGGCLFSNYSCLNISSSPPHLHFIVSFPPAQSAGSVLLEDTYNGNGNIFSALAIQYSLTTTNISSTDPG